MSQESAKIVSLLGENTIQKIQIVLLCGLFFCFFDRATGHAGSLFLDQGSNLYPLHWKCRVLTTGPPESPK